jgi:ABC-type nitrate/sulfonate/bicarbonate transport system permease component
MMMRSMLWGQPVRRWQDRLQPNFWDLVAFPLLFGLLAMILVGAGGMTKPFDLGEPQTISLDPTNLPYYAMRTVLRMLIALGVSFLFTLTYAAAAAKSRMAEKILIPILDILQSIPILSFLTITVTGWIALFPRCAPCRSTCRRPPACITSGHGAGSGGSSCRTRCRISSGT